MDTASEARAIAYVIAGLIVLRLVAGALLPLSADEAYYWLWSRDLAAGYFDHPPAIAWCIRLGTLLFGKTALGVRLVPILLSVPATFFVWRCARTLLGDDLAGAWSALYFNLTLMVAVEALAATPDAPAIAFSAGFLFTLAKVQETHDGRWWLAAGVAAGLALLSKYTAFFLGLGALAWLVFVPSARRWLLSPWTYAGGAVALLLFSPNLVWNAQHGWATFAFQFERVGAGDFTLRFLAEFIGAQLLLATPFIFVLGSAGTGLAVRQEKSALLAAILGPSILYFAVHSLHDRVQGNWPSFLYPAFAIAVEVAYRTDFQGRAAGAMRFMKAWAVRLAAVMIVAAYAQALFGIVPLGRADPLARLLAVGFGDVGKAVERDRVGAGAAAILTSDYATTAWLAFYAPSQAAIIPVTENQRWTMATPAPASLFAKPLLYVVEARNVRLDEISARFANVVPLGEVDRRRGKALIARYLIYRVSGARGNPTYPQL